MANAKAKTAQAGKATKAVTKTTKITKAAGKTKAPTEVVLVASKVKGMIRDAGCNTASDAIDGLNAYVGWLIQQATARATQNGRKTVRSHDFIIS